MKKKKEKKKKTIKMEKEVWNGKMVIGLLEEPIAVFCTPIKSKNWGVWSKNENGLPEPKQHSSAQKKGGVHWNCMVNQQKSQWAWWSPQLTSFHNHQGGALAMCVYGKQISMDFTEIEPNTHLCWLIQVNRVQMKFLAHAKSSPSFTLAHRANVRRRHRC